MIALGDIFRRYGPAYRAAHGTQLSSDQRAVMHAIEACRTAALGGQLYRCPQCATIRYSYHSCRNRHCPTCQHDAAQAWLTRQQDLLLPVPYFLVTFTLPAPFRALAQQHPKRLYDHFFRASADALRQLAQDPRFLGAQIGMLGVLQTWTRDLRFHPHIHYLVPGGGLAPDERTWKTAKHDFFLHVKPLAALFRAKLRAALRQTDLWSALPATVWTQDWVVDCRPVGNGQTALKYLAPYIFRVALSNNRILRVQDDQVMFRYQDGKTRQTHTCTLPADTFIQRFLQHVLPKGFVKVRYYGLFRVGARRQLARLQAQVQLQQRKADLAPPAAAVPPPAPAYDMICPHCGALMQLERILPPQRAPPCGAQAS